jgi:hypothetical protein
MVLGMNVLLGVNFFSRRKLGLFDFIDRIKKFR